MMLLDSQHFFFSIQVDTLSYVSVQPDNSKYTIAGIHYDPVTDQLLALSPGLFGNDSWTLVVVDPAKGAVTAKFRVAPIGKFTGYYGGDVFGFDYETGYLQYAFYTTKDLSSGVIASINVDSGATSYTPNIPFLGSIHNLANLAFSSQEL